MSLRYSHITFNTRLGPKSQHRTTTTNNSQTTEKSTLSHCSDSRFFYSCRILGVRALFSVLFVIFPIRFYYILPYLLQASVLFFPLACQPTLFFRVCGFRSSVHKSLALIWPNDIVVVPFLTYESVYKYHFDFDYD